MAYRVTIECDTAAEAQRLRERIQQPQSQPQVREDRPLREQEPYCYRCESHGCICRRISTGYMIG